MNSNVAKSSTHLVILRPYALSSESSLANDRYFNLANATSQTGARVTLLAQSYSHSRLLQRSAIELQVIEKKYSFTRFVSVPSYKKSNGLGRLCAELSYALKAFVLLVGLRPSHVLVGEPLFFTGWLAISYGWLFRKSVACDLIDAWPEALAIPKRHPFDLIVPYNIFFFPLIASRTLRLMFYARLFTVSTSYINLVPSSKRLRVNVFYWCSQALLPAAIHSINERPQNHSGLSAPFIVSYAGSLGSGYDIETIIESAKNLERCFPGCFVFRIAGGGHKSSLLDASSICNLNFLGYLSSSDVCAMLSSSHAMLLPYAPNSAVAMPIKFFDAINLRLPVVSSLELEARDLIEMHKIGVYYKSRNPESLSESILAMREDYPSYHRNIRVFADSFSGMYNSSESYKNFATQLVS
jgi:glycosyltransferase involved in cell wall biosynthesis